MSGVEPGPDGKPRCFWALGTDDYLDYHDNEWGRPLHGENELYERLTLEAFQSGLSWLTILRKRENFRRAFDGFDAERVAAYGSKEVERLLGDAGIVRHRGKIAATVNNARRYLELIDESGSLAAYLWSFEPDPTTRPMRLDRDALLTMDATAESTALSKDLRRRGWAFVGPTTVYAAMQAMGIVDDHLEGCFSRPIVEDERARFVRPAA